MRDYTKLVRLSPLHTDLNTNGISINPKFYSSKNKSAASKLKSQTVVKKRKSGQSLTTPGLDQSAVVYQDAIMAAERIVEDALRHLNSAIEQHLLTIGLAEHFIVIFQVRFPLLDIFHTSNTTTTTQFQYLLLFERLSSQTAYLHALHTLIGRGWCCPELEPSDLTSKSVPSFAMEGIFPYWLQGSSHGFNQGASPSAEFFDGESSLKPSTSITDFQIDGVVLLTGPNMAGKSTLMKSTLAVALLANCGLMTPCRSAYVPR